MFLVSLSIGLHLLHGVSFVALPTQATLLLRLLLRVRSHSLSLCGGSVILVGVCLPKEGAPESRVPRAFGVFVVALGSALPIIICEESLGT